MTSLDGAIQSRGPPRIEAGEQEELRAGLYALLAALLIKPADAEMLARLTGLDAAEGPMGEALGALGLAARDSLAEAVEDEFTLLFHGHGQGGEVLPYASYYLTGNLHDRPLARLRGDMERLGIAHGGLNKEPEDHVASLFEIMHGLIAGRFEAGEVELAGQREFFDAHLAPWGEDFFVDLEAADSAVLYRAIAGVGRVFMSIERQAFDMAA